MRRKSHGREMLKMYAHVFRGNNLLEKCLTVVHKLKKSTMLTAFFFQAILSSSLFYGQSF